MADVERRERAVRRWGCVVAGGVVEPLLIALVSVGDPAAVLWLAPITIWPWIVAGWVRRTWSHVAIGVLAFVVLYGTAALIDDDENGIGLGLLIAATYLVAGALGVVSAGSTLRRSGR